MKTLNSIDKKYRYLIYSVVISVYAYFASILFWNYSFYVRVGVGLVLLLVGVLFVHYPNVGFSGKRLMNTFMVLVLPYCLFFSVLLALKYYPNLSWAFKVLMLVATGALFYVVSIVDNIFLVINQREETIPLYRAAIPWSQILVVVVAIPLFAGIFKMPIYSFIQVFIIAIFSVVFNLYQFWTYRHEVNLVPLGVGGRALFALLAGFFVLCIGIATSFIATESFLRGLNTAAALMFGLVYTSSFLKNNVNQKVLLQYLGIVFGFVFLSFVFA